jgi:PST family polysaccharide transporter
MSQTSLPAALEVAAVAPDANDWHFRTDHLHANLKGRSIRGGAITLAAQAIKFILQLASTAVLARLLTPADFGLVAMVTAVTGFVAMFKDLGLSAATIQRPHITHAQVSTLFWINLALSAIFMIITAAIAPVLAWLYGEPRLIGITLVLAATFLVGGLTVQHDALLRRQMRLGVIAFIEVISLAAGVAVAIILAMRGAGYWSLVFMTPVTCIVGVALVWTFTGWRPGLPIHRSGVREMLAFGGNISAYNAVGYLSRNADNVLIGWMWGATSLGYYSKAYQLLMLPLSQVSTPLYNVVVPALSRLQNDPEAFEAYFLQVLKTIFWLTAPAVGLLAACSDQIILLLLGPGWTETSVLFRIMAISALVQPLHFTMPWALISRGRTRELFWWGMGTTASLVGCYLIGLHFGVRGVAVSYVVGFVGFGLLWVFFFALPRACVQRVRVLRAIAAPLLTSALVFITATAALHFVRVENRVAQIVLAGLPGLAILIVQTIRNRPLAILVSQFRPSEPREP